MIPAILLFVSAVIIPFLTGFVYSLTNWRNTYFWTGTVRDGHKVDHWFQSFVGLKNYGTILLRSEFLSSFAYTIFFVIVSVIMITITSLLLSLMISTSGKRQNFFRAVYYMPNMLSGLALGFIWQFIFEILFTKVFFGPDSLFPVSFLCDMTHNKWKALFALAIVATWQMAGYMVLILSNGLKNIPQDLYEASQVMGATMWQRFRYVTFPMLMPAFTVVFFLSLANCLKVFDLNVALTNGDFGARLMALDIVKTVDESYRNYGLAQAEAMIFFVIVAIVTLRQMNIFRAKEEEL
jgi:raffinose/stachyose/melibiose transport system permease protein